MAAVELLPELLLPFTLIYLELLRTFKFLLTAYYFFLFAAAVANYLFRSIKFTFGLKLVIVVGSSGLLMVKTDYSYSWKLLAAEFSSLSIASRSTYFPKETILASSSGNSNFLGGSSYLCAKGNLFYCWGLGE